MSVVAEMGTSQARPVQSSVRVSTSSHSGELVHGIVKVYYILCLVSCMQILMSVSTALHTTALKLIMRSVKTLMARMCVSACLVLMVSHVQVS